MPLARGLGRTDWSLATSGNFENYFMHFGMTVSNEGRMAGRSEYFLPIKWGDSPQSEKAN
jgi:hypothetical protein